MYTVKYSATANANEAVDLVFFLLEVRAIARSSASGARDRSLKIRDEVSTPAKRRNFTSPRGK